MSTVWTAHDATLFTTGFMGREVLHDLALCHHPDACSWTKHTYTGTPLVMRSVCVWSSLVGKENSCRRECVPGVATNIVYVGGAGPGTNAPPVGQGGLQ